MPGEHRESAERQPSVLPSDMTNDPENQDVFASSTASATQTPPPDARESADSAERSDRPIPLREAAQATLTRAPATPTSETAAHPAETQAGAARRPAISRPPGSFSRFRRPLLILTGAALIIITLVLLLTTSVRGGSPTTAHHPPTATPRPTATATKIPSPTAMPGFQLFVDTTDGFMLQYPVGWVQHLNNPGAEFSDDAGNPTFEMQVLLPSDSAAAGLTGDPNDPQSWVNFAMESFATQYAGQFQEDAGPLPAAQFAGATWQTARGIITDQVRIRVQVYATVYQGKPYIISLFASDDAFSVADTVYFQPMRLSFQFLPPTP